MARNWMESLNEIFSGTGQNLVKYGQYKKDEENRAEEKAYNRGQDHLDEIYRMMNFQEQQKARAAEAARNAENTKYNRGEDALKKIFSMQEYADKLGQDKRDYELDVRKTNAQIEADRALANQRNTPKQLYAPAIDAGKKAEYEFYGSRATGNNDFPPVTPATIDSAATVRQNATLANLYRQNPSLAWSYEKDPNDPPFEQLTPEDQQAYIDDVEARLSIGQPSQQTAPQQDRGWLDVLKGLFD